MNELKAYFYFKVFISASGIPVLVNLLLSYLGYLFLAGVPSLKLYMLLTPSLSMFA